MVWGGTTTLPSIGFYIIGGLALLSTIMLVMTIMGLRSNPLFKAINEAAKGDRRLVWIHFASGQGKLVVPKLIEPKDTDGETSPYWVIDGTYRFKDATGEKWESMGNFKVLHYTARTTSAVSTDQAVAIDQLNDLLANYGHLTRGFLKEVFYMINESAKGQQAEDRAFKALAEQSNEYTLSKVKEILDFIKSHPEVKYVLLKSGAFTYKTSVSVLDQLIANGVTNLSHTISFVEDRTRRKLNSQFDNMLKWAIIIAPIIFAVAVGGVMFLVGTGMVKV